MVQNLGPTTNFSSAYGSSWGFAYTKLWYQRGLENWSWPKRIGSSIRKFDFSKFLLLHSLCQNCRSTCPLAHRVLLSKMTSRLYESLLLCLGGRDASASAICWFWGPFEPRDVTFQQNFVIFKFSTGTMETCSPFKLFTQPMDRAEGLHVPSYGPRGG